MSKQAVGKKRVDVMSGSNRHSEQCALRLAPIFDDGKVSRASVGHKNFKFQSGSEWLVRSFSLVFVFFTDAVEAFVAVWLDRGIDKTINALFAVKGASIDAENLRCFLFTAARFV